MRAVDAPDIAKSYEYHHDIIKGFATNLAQQCRRQNYAFAPYTADGKCYLNIKELFTATIPDKLSVYYRPNDNICVSQCAIMPNVYIDNWNACRYYAKLEIMIGKENRWIVDMRLWLLSIGDTARNHLGSISLDIADPNSFDISSKWLLTMCDEWLN